jgi:2-C-methyl-D-erythritol 4-phosphate cytidylyltransferase
VVPVVPVVETVRQLLADGSSMTVDRNAYRLVQTPQTFDIQLLKKAYGQPFDPFFTDDASVVEAMGHPIKLVEGNNENIKLTNPADLKLAEGMV